MKANRFISGRLGEIVALTINARDVRPVIEFNQRDDLQHISIADHEICEFAIEFVSQCLPRLASQGGILGEERSESDLWKQGSKAQWAGSYNMRTFSESCRL